MSACPPQSDSPLSVAANWIGIVTFITTTIGGLTIFYTIFKAYEKAQDDLIEYGQAMSTSSREWIADIETMEPMLLRRASDGPASGRQLLDSALGLILQVRKLAKRLDAALNAGVTKKRRGLLGFVDVYRLAQSSEVSNAMKELQRIAPSLLAMKMNLILM
ncbi:hypothetical protein IFR04_011297 [Cadophora malorum]|uniref:Uncharacterized protein n=1 Tax=Cadophora malorum TaxID=108018 RepID=A0A8H7TAJ6_9HELO|nr:hypothetical protein IFR04_011297 [Cadophora malorum]